MKGRRADKTYLDKIITMIELIEDDLYYILKSSRSTLWCSKIDGSFSIHPPDDIMKAMNPICLGIVYALIGKFRMGNDGDWKLLLVKKVQEVGTLPPRNSRCFKITQILVLTLNPDVHFSKDQDIEPCPKHRSSGGSTKMFIANNLSSMKTPLQKKWNQFMNAAESIKPKKLAYKLSPITQIISGVSSNMPNISQKDSKDRDKFEKRVMEELHRMFNEADSFYFTRDGGDLTNNIQATQMKTNSQKDSESWKEAETDFFWNMYMLNDLIKLSEHNESANEWILPMIQGYVQIEECPIKFEDEEDVMKLPCEDLMKIKMCIISRRSRHRTGTRYKRRGVDGDGNTANFVETEQVLEFISHVVSFTQIRGSIPLYWSQSGMKYRPPPKIEKDFDQNHKAFSKHLHSLMDKYGDINIISLIDQDGREKIIGDVLLQHILAFNHPNISYVTFDFHEYCQGMKFENVSILTENVLSIIQDMKYCWVDKNGLICKQKGAFRVNCMDCLDRTNIVQSAIARIVLEIQFRKLGLLSPERQLSGNYKSLYQQMWANNGDIISRQYAGTAALKGDYTRTGERKFTGMMRDGVNSANRYFINQVKDVYRQATMDLMQGNVDIWDSLDGTKIDEGNELNYQKDEDFKGVIEDCKKLLVLEPEHCLGSWGLVNCERLAENILNEMFGDFTLQAADVDIILLLSNNFIYVAHYDDIRDCVMSYQKIALESIAYIELGLTSFAPKLFQLCFRIFYQPKERHSSECHLNFHTFCLPGAKLLNIGSGNFKNADEIKENLMSIVQAIAAASKCNGNLVKIVESKIDCQMRSKSHQEMVTIASHAQKMVDTNLLETLCLPEVSPIPINLTNEPISLTYDVSSSTPSHYQPFEKTLVEHVQKTRKLQLELKELIQSSITSYDHVCLPSCGILVIRSKNQLKLGLIREAESFHYVNVSNYFETIHLLRQFSESVTNMNEISYLNNFLKKKSMLNKQNKSRSLDSSCMLQRIKQVSKNTVLKMSALTEEEEKMISDEAVHNNENPILLLNYESTPHVLCLPDNNKSRPVVCEVNEDNKSDSFEKIEPASYDEQDVSIPSNSLHNFNQMKNSKSENSFMNGTSSYDLLSDTDDFDFLEHSTSLTALSKFKRKFVQLTLLSQQVGVSQSAQGRQAMELEQMRKQAHSNALRSKLRFQYLKSKIVLL